MVTLLDYYVKENILKNKLDDDIMLKGQINFKN